MSKKTDIEESKLQDPEEIMVEGSRQLPIEIDEEMFPTAQNSTENPIVLDDSPNEDTAIRELVAEGERMVEAGEWIDSETDSNQNQRIDLPIQDDDNEPLHHFNLRLNEYDHRLLVERGDHPFFCFLPS